ncbi:MAG: hypothetical protein E7600_03525 [Ruminococcaceae bacterium]|nr:hypothetical protein [Oscillospiraceae bacterium]
MAKNLYKAKFEDKLPLGGIGTGHITLGCDGSITSPMSDSSNLSFFVIKAEKDGELFDARIIQSSQNEAISLPCFENSTASSFFPFTELCFFDSSFPADVKMTAFSPFIPLNDTDSGIPAVSFAFEVTNKSEDRIDYSIGLVSSNINHNAYNRMGCTDTGEAYIYLSGDCENPQNTCIATDGKNVSFCEYIKSTDGFIKNFTENPTLYNKTKAECSVSFASGGICTHFSLCGGENQKCTFCLSWYNPQNELSRNYYAQYFESSLECASYFLRQYDRLCSQSFEFSKNIFGATISEATIENVNKELFTLIGRKLLRLDDGALVSDTKVRFSDMDSFLWRSDALTSLFPNLEYSETERLYKSGMYENANDEEKLISILRSYRKYLLSGDTDALIEDWYYIVKCMEGVFGEDGKKQSKTDIGIQCAATSAASIMAEAVKDKKRHELYSAMCEGFPLCQVSMDIAEGFAAINEISGFEYRADIKHIGFNPKSDLCPLDIGGTFRCFFCTPSCYGYVEEGIDYIEINLLYGSLSVRSFGVPRVPRLVQYGGRNWRFEDKNLVTVLDSDLEVTPHKKLTIFIDIKQ